MTGFFKQKMIPLSGKASLDTVQQDQTAEPLAQDSYQDPEKIPVTKEVFRGDYLGEQLINFNDVQNGKEFEYQIPTRTIALVKSLRLVLNTDSTVATRYSSLKFSIPGNLPTPYFQSSSTYGLATTNSNLKLIFTIDYPLASDSAPDNDNYLRSWIPKYYLDDTQKIATRTVNMDPNDQYTDVYMKADFWSIAFIGSSKVKSKK